MRMTLEETGLLVFAGWAIAGSLALGACGGSAPGSGEPVVTTTTMPARDASVSHPHDVIDGFDSWDKPGIDGQWIVTEDPDGQEYLCYVVSESIREDSASGNGLGVGIGVGVSCHERWKP